MYGRMTQTRRFYCICAQVCCLVAVVVVLKLQVGRRLSPGPRLAALVNRVWANRTAPRHARTVLPPPSAANPWTLIDRPPLFYHSAFWDDRDSNAAPLVRLLGVQLLDTKCSLECLGWLRRKRLRVAAKCDFIKSWRQTPFREMYFDCDFGGDKPEWVALVKKDASFEAAKSVEVQYPVEGAPSPSLLTVCVPPLYNWTDPKSLSLFFDYYTYYGADSFYLFNYSWDAATDHYIRRSNFNFSLTVIPWPNFPPNLKLGNRLITMENRSDIHSHAHIVAINYCLLHSYHRKTAFALIIDVDEFLWLRGFTQRGGILNYLRQTDGSRIGGQLFRSSPVRLTIANDSAVALRSKFVFPANERSKMLVKPFAVLTQWIHFTDKYIRGFETVRADPAKAIVFHVHFDAFAKFGRHAMHDDKAKYGFKQVGTVNETLFAEKFKWFVGNAKLLI